ncbi:type IV toxin-antitoxin system AbiEi family antitoxin [Brevibacterium sp. 1718]|uniref:type IV toxin-antitoxin system AbiEi family antitoxin n=1 Tax=Brevibacterium sp. 1718 TaxID=3413510 RepID=UPI003DA8D3E2
MSNLNIEHGDDLVRGEASGVNELTKRIVEQLSALNPEIVATSNVVHDTFEADVELAVPTLDGPRRVVLEIGWGPQEGLIRKYRHIRSRARGPVVLGLPYVGTATARRLRAEGIPFIDASGNAWIDLPGFYIEIEGRRPVMKKPHQRRAGIGELSAAELRVAFVILIDSSLLYQPVRVIAQAARVSTGSAQAALASMAKDRLITRGRNARLRESEELTQIWLSGYWSRLLPRLEEETVFGPEPTWWTNPGGDSAEMIGRVSGEAALAALTNRIVPEATIVYGEPAWQDMRRRARLSAAGTGSRVMLRERFWDPAALEGAIGESATVPPLLIYADCRASDDPRVREVAEELDYRPHVLGAQR